MPADFLKRVRARGAIPTPFSKGTPFDPATFDAEAYNRSTLLPRPLAIVHRKPLVELSEVLREPQHK